MAISKEQPSVVRIDMPNKTQEFLGLIRNPSRAIKDIVTRSQEARDPFPHEKFI